MVPIRRRCVVVAKQYVAGVMLMLAIGAGLLTDGCSATPRGSVPDPSEKSPLTVASEQSGRLRSPSPTPGPVDGLVEPPPPPTTPNNVAVVWPGRLVGSDELVIAGKPQPVADLNFYNGSNSDQHWSVDVDVTKTLGQPALTVASVIGDLRLPGTVYFASRTSPSQALEVTIPPGLSHQVVSWGGTATNGARLALGRYELVITARQDSEGGHAAAFTKEVDVQ